MLSDIYFLPLQGRLTGLGGEDLPTVVIVAHYDSFGVAPVSILFFLKPSLPSVPFYFSPLNLYFLLLLKTNSSFKVEHRDVLMHPWEWGSPGYFWVQPSIPATYPSLTEHISVQEEDKLRHIFSSSNIISCSFIKARCCWQISCSLPCFSIK